MKQSLREKTKLTRQQQQAKDFFDIKASEWQQKADGRIAQKVNVIKQRNAYVLKVAASRARTKYALDVGSGIGDLVFSLAKRGIKATGIDIAGGMIDLAHQRSVDEKIDLVEFITSDYFDYHVPNGSYDLVSANGFIEYISYQQRDAFLEDSFRILAPGGSLVISSRNRLFNLFSANDYTDQEIADGATPLLLKEVLALARRAHVSELLQQETVPFQAEDMQHIDTGIGVSTRYQYTPIQLMKLLSKAGFAIAGLSPVHIHAAPPAFKALHPDVHFKLATFLQTYALEDRHLLSTASAFMLHATKPV